MIGEHNPPSPNTHHLSPGTLDVITSLVDKSLVQRTEGSDDPRFVLLETIREFGLEQLAANEEDAGTRQAHAAYYLALAERAEPALIGAEQARWLDRLEADHDNLRVAFATALSEAGDADGALRQARALARFWRMHGHFTEGRAWFARVLARPGPRTVVRARALTAAADLANSQGDYEHAAPLFAEALAIFQECGDKAGIAESLAGMSSSAIGQSDFRLAVELNEQALALFRQTDRTWEIATTLNNLAIAAFRQGDVAGAATRWEECLLLLRRLGDERSIAIVLSNLAVVALQRDQLDQAIALHEEALAIARRLGDPWVETNALINLGRVLTLRGQFDDATPILEQALRHTREMGDVPRSAVILHNIGQVTLGQQQLARAGGLFAESLRLAHQVGDKVIIADCLDSLAALAGAGENALGGARLFGASAALRTETGIAREVVDQPAYDRDVATLRAALDLHAFETAWAAGEALPLDQAVAEALASAPA